MPRLTLAEEVAYYAARGFIIESLTDSAAQLRKPRSFSLLAFVLMLGVFYLPVYLAKSDELIYLYVDAAGVVHRQGGKWTLGDWMARRMSGRA